MAPSDNRPQSSGGGRMTNTCLPLSKNGGMHTQVGKHDLVAQLSLAPATQTTVVTTTTTTTINYPPFVLPGPNKNHQLNTEQYPLLNSPTPQSLQHMSFNLGGEKTLFSEASDSTLALKQFRREHKTLHRANGTLQRIRTDDTRVESEPSHSLDPVAHSGRESEPRLASPDSSPDHEHARNEEGSMRHTKRRKIAEIHGQPVFPAHSRLRGTESNPLTPESQPRRGANSHRAGRNANHDTHHAVTVLPTPGLEQPSTFASSHAASPGTLVGERDSDIEMNGGQVAEHSPGLQDRLRGASHDTTVPTPPIESDEERRSLSRRALSSIPARLHVTGSPSAQDGSLPSPSLSPVTAAATLQNGGYFADIDSSTEYAEHTESPLSAHRLRQHTPSRSAYGSAEPIQELVLFKASQRAPNFGSFSLREIPAMLDYFEAMPDELKGYVMHQMLRRCPRSTLHAVADVVNPALKCDFVAALPIECAWKVLRFLDLKSLCKAAQVSKVWRARVNADEVWKELLDVDGFTLLEGEKQQAEAQEWGEQDPYGIDGYEMNLPLAKAIIKSEKEVTSASPCASNNSTSAGPLRRSGRKRKATTRLSSRHRQPKRKRTSRNSRETSMDTTTTDGMETMATADGPYWATLAAAKTTLDANVGLPSLKLERPHLQKSLYRRHYLIRKNWMCEDTKPRHIAFRAHDTHVVTCLQFDTDKILTGSDDNNINVYDTKTGAQRGKLEGHEGGVWALQYEGNTLVSGSTDRSVRVWDIATTEQRQVFRGHTSTVRCLQIVAPVKIGVNAQNQPIVMPKQPLIITGSRDSTLRVWRLPKPEDPRFIQQETDTDADDCPWFLRTLTGHQHSVRAIAAHGDTLVSGSYDCTVRVWKISTGESVLTLRGHAQKVYSVVLDHVRNRCISGSMDNMVRIWDLDTGALQYSLEGHSSLVGLLDLQCDRLVSAAADSTLRIWDPENGSCKATLTAHTGAITCFQHDGQKVISGSDRTLKLWDIRRGECVKDLLSDLSGVWQVRFDERRCVSAVQRDGVTFIEVLDFGAARDGIPEDRRGRRIVVDRWGEEGRPYNVDILDANDDG